MLIPILIHRLIALILIGLASLTGADLDQSNEPPAVVVAPDPSTTTTVAPPTTLPADLPAPDAPEPDASEPDGGPAQLVVDTGDIILSPGVFFGVFELTNVGGQPAGWTWVGDPRVEVSTIGGSLAPGESILVSFEIDSSALNPGANLLANCITYDEGAVDVWITATKTSHPTIPASFAS
jgi:hypothetical protein